jgi:site-specific DNA recombinase
MNNRKGLRVFVYVRVSTQEQAKEGYSIDEQIERLRDYCKALGWIIVKVYTDAGYSGGNTDRPALQDMIRDIEEKKGDAVVVYKLDRLSRSQKDTLELIEDYFLANNVDFVSMNENFDTGTSFGRAMIGILAVFAQLEREQIKERMAMGREGRAKEGKYHGGSTYPIGYDYINSELVINEYEAMQVRELFDLYISGMPFRQIESLFHEKGYSHHCGTWTASSMRKVMKNPVYIGKIRFADTVYQGIHDPILDNETFEKANKILAERQEAFVTKNRRNSGSTYLGGLLKCKHCGGKYGVHRCVSRGKQFNYYNCYSRRKSCRSMIKDPNCKNKTWRMESLDNLVLEEIKKLAFDPNFYHEIKQDNYSEDDRTKENIIKKEISKIDAQKSRFMDLYGVGEFTMEEVQAKVAPLNEQKSKLQAELKKITDGKSTMTEEDVYEIVKDFDGIMERNVYAEIRLMIESLIDEIEIDNEDVKIYWKFA